MLHRQKNSQNSNLPRRLWRKEQNTSAAEPACSEHTSWNKYVRTWTVSGVSFETEFVTNAPRKRLTLGFHFSQRYGRNPPLDTSVIGNAIISDQGYCTLLIQRRTPEVGGRPSAYIFGLTLGYRYNMPRAVIIPYPVNWWTPPSRMSLSCLIFGPRSLLLLSIGTRGSQISQKLVKIVWKTRPAQRKRRKIYWRRRRCSSGTKYVDEKHEYLFDNS